MSEFISYTRNNGFDPIIIPDTSERDLRQQQRELDQRRQAYEFGRDNRRNVQNQLEKNQTIEANNRKDNFELQDTFIKQRRAAEKRNFERRISSLQQEQRDSQALIKLATNFSATAASIYNDQIESRREAERDQAYSLIYKYGVTSEEKEALSKGEQEMFDMQERLNPVIADLKARGASADEISTLSNLSGYAEYGANRALAERAGRDFSAYALNSTTEYNINGRKMTLLGAITEGDEVATRTILAQKRTEYIKQAVPGMDPIFLDRYMFDSMRQFENTMAGQAQDNRLKAVKAELKAKSLQQLYADLLDPKGNGGQLLVDRLQAAGKGQKEVKWAEIYAQLQGMAVSDPTLLQTAVPLILNAVTTRTSDGAVGTYGDLFPGKRALLEALQKQAVKQQLDSDQTRRAYVEEQKEKLKDAFQERYRGAPLEQIEKALKQLENSGKPGQREAAAEIRETLPNNPLSGEAIRDADIWRNWSEAAAAGRPPSIFDINSTRDASPELKRKAIKEFGVMDQYDDDFFNQYNDEIEAIITSKFSKNDLGDPLGDASIFPALRDANAEFRKVFMGQIKIGVPEAKAYEFARNWLVGETKEGGRYFSPDIVDKQGINKRGFVKFQPGSNLPQESDEMVRRFEQNDYNPSTVKMIEKSDLLKLLEYYYDNQTLPSSAGRLQRAADRTPKVDLYDVLNGQIEFHGLEGAPIKNKFTITRFENIFAPPPIPEVEEGNDEYQMLLNNWEQSMMRLNYMPNSTRSRIAQIGMGGSAGPGDLPYSDNQRAAMEAAASVESGGLGYEAVNQGTDAYGNILGSGLLSDIPQHRSKTLVDLTLRELIAIQNDSFAGSDAEWRALGGVWAAGRYQFIPSTLLGLINDNNLDLNLKFTPALQDWLFLKLLKSQGPMAWEGVKDRPDLIAIMYAAKGEPIPAFQGSTSPWRVGDYIDDAVSERLWQQVNGTE